MQPQTSSPDESEAWANATLGTPLPAAQASPVIATPEVSPANDDSEAWAQKTLGDAPKQPSPLMESATGGFLTSLGGAIAKHVAQNMIETGQTPSLGGMLKQAGQLGLEGLRTGIEGMARLEAGAISPILSSQQLKDVQDVAPKDFPTDATQYPIKARLKEVMDGAELKPGETISNLTQSAAAEQVNQGPIGEFVGMRYAMLNVFSPIFSVAEDTYRNMNSGDGKGTSSSGDVEANIQSANAIMNILGLVATPHLTPEEKVDGAKWDVGFDEDTYMGTKPRSPEQEATILNADNLQQKNAPDVQELSAGKTSSPPNVNAVARSFAPGEFNRYDEAKSRRDFYGDTLRQLAENRDAAAAEAEKNSPQPHAEQLQGISGQIKVILDKVNGVEDRLTKTKAAQLEDLRNRQGALQEDGAREAENRPGPSDTPDMAAVREAWYKQDAIIREVEPAVRKATMDAADHIKSETVEPPPEVKEKEAEQEPASIPPKEKTQPSMPSAEEKEHQSIIDDVVKKQVAAGRPVGEANTTAQVTANFFRTMSQLYKGEKGSAADWYKREGADIKPGKNSAKTFKQSTGANTFEQANKGTFTTWGGKVRSVIKLFSTADASTFLHESGHHFLDIMERYAKMDDAPEQLKKDYQIARDYLKVKEGEAIKPSQHEMFARSFENYLREGIAPSKGLADLFAKFKRILTNIYKTADALKAPINDAIRGVFDRLLSPESGRTIIAREYPFGKMAADVHEEDVRSTPPERAHEVADNIEKEIDATAKLHDPEVADAIKSAKTKDIPESSEGDTGTSAAGQPAGDSSAPTESGAVAGGGSGLAPESTPARTAGGSGKFGKRAAANSGGDEAGKPTGPNVKFGKSKSSLVDKAGNIRIDLLNSTDDVNNVIRETAAANNDFMPERRGVVSNGMTLDLADALGMGPAMLDMRKVGQAFNAHQIGAAVKLLIQSGQWVSDAAKSGDVEAYLEARERHKMIQGHVSGITAEAGRALQIFQALKNIEGYDKASAMSNFLKDKDNGKTFFQLEKEMEYASKLETPEQVSKFVEDSKKPGFKDKIIEYYVNALISGPVTHFCYAVGNAVNALWTPLVEVPFSAAYHAITQYAGEDRVRFGEVGAQLYALGKGMRDGWSAAGLAFKSGDSPLLPTERSSAGMMPHKGAIEGALGTAIRIPSKSVAAIHSFFKSVRYEQNIAALAYRTAFNEGYEVGSHGFDNRIGELTMRPTPEMMDETGKIDPDKVDPKLLENMTSATNDTLRELYMAPTDYHSAMGTLTRWTNTSLPAKVIFPFMKIGSQITKNAFLDRTPLGVFSKDIRDNLFGVNGEAARAMQIGRMGAGISLVSIGVLAAAEGYVTGDGPTDPSQRREWLKTHHPNSITIGGISLSNPGGSIGMLLRFAANAYETSHEWGENEGHTFAQNLLNGFEGVTKSVLDENFMRGAKDILDAVYHPQVYGEDFIRNFALNWLPYSVGIGQIARKTDPYERDVNGMFDALRSKIPGWRESLEPKIDSFGRPIQRGALYSDYQNDPVEKKLQSLGVGIAKPQRKINNVQLTSDQYNHYAIKAGQLTYQALTRLMNNPEFSQKSTEQQTLDIHQRVEAANEAARAIIKHMYPQIARQATANKKSLLGKVR
jgi:hypothetical protein